MAGGATLTTAGRTRVSLFVGLLSTAALTTSGTPVPHPQYVAASLHFHPLRCRAAASGLVWEQGKEGDRQGEIGCADGDWSGGPGVESRRDAHEMGVSRETGRHRTPCSAASVHQTTGLIAPPSNDERVALCLKSRASNEIPSILDHAERSLDFRSA